MQLDLQSVGTTKPTNKDIANYVKGRLKKVVNVQCHMKFFPSVTISKMIMKTPYLLTCIFAILNVVTVPKCLCER